MRYAHFDVIRSLMVLTVFLAHAADWSFKGTVFRDIMLVLSPGLTMTLLGFLSAVLLTEKTGDTGVFLIRRGLRIFVPLFLCNAVVMAIQWVNGGLALNQDTLLHLMGLSLFFHMFESTNSASIGAGLWFISAILAMYIFLPVIRHLLSQAKAGVWLILMIAACLSLDYVLYNTESFFAVVIGFCMGVYHQQNRLPTLSLPWLLLGNAALFAMLFWATTTEGWLDKRFVFIPLYALLTYPLLYELALKAPAGIKSISTAFSVISFEFYLLHFYFLYPYWKGWVPSGGAWVAVLAACVVTLVLARLLQPLGQYGAKKIGQLMGVEASGSVSKGRVAGDPVSK